MFGNHPIKIKSKNLIFLALIFLFSGSCKKNDSAKVELTSNSISRSASDLKLLNAAKQFYADQKNLPVADNQKGPRPVDFLVPDWNSVKYVFNSNGEKILGVSLSFSDQQYNELNVLIKDGITYGIIKRYDHKSKESSNVTMVTPAGFVLGTGVSSTTNVSGKIQISYKIMSQSYSPKFTKMEETVNGGELEEVVITPGGGGTAPYVPVVFPSSPVIPNPTQPYIPSEVGPTSSEPEEMDYYPDYGINQVIEFKVMPTKEAFIAAFPNLPAQQIYDEIGGAVKDARVADPIKWNNACALRISVALNKLGITIPVIPGKTLKGKDGKNYIYRVGVLEQFMAKTFGEPTTKLEFPTVATAKYAMDRTAGVYIMTAKSQAIYHATGHATYVNNATRSDLEINAPGGVARIAVWPFSTQ